MATTTYTETGFISTEIVNGHAFTVELKRYPDGTRRTFNRMDGKIVAISDWIHRRSIQRRLERKRQAEAQHEA
jgi:hypothetical protein